MILLFTRAKALLTVCLTLFALNISMAQMAVSTAASERATIYPKTAPYAKNIQAVRARLNVTASGPEFLGLTFSYIGSNFADVSNFRIMETGQNGTFDPLSGTAVFLGTPTVTGNVLEFRFQRVATSTGGRDFVLLVDIEPTAAVGNRMGFRFMSYDINFGTPVNATYNAGNPSTTEILAQLSGTYTLNTDIAESNANYTSFRTFCNDLAAMGVAASGAQLVVQDGQVHPFAYSNNNFPLLNQLSIGSGGLYITRSHTSTPPVMLANKTDGTETPMLRIYGSTNITFNGLNFVSTVVGNNRPAIFLQVSPTFLYPTNNIAITNCVFDIVDAKAGGNGTNGSIYIGEGNTNLTLSGVNNIKILNNTFTGGLVGIRMNAVRFCDFDNIEVGHNTLRALSISGMGINGTDVSGIQFGFSNISIHNNVIENFIPSSLSNTRSGIECYRIKSDAYIYNNTIRNIVNENTTNSTLVRGIALHSRVASNGEATLYVFNNNISNLNAPFSTLPTQARYYPVRGIEFTDAAGVGTNTNVLITNNSISLSGKDKPAVALMQVQAGFNNQFSLFNNLISVTDEGSGNRTAMYVSLNGVITQINTDSKNNIYTISGASSYFMVTGGSQHTTPTYAATTFADWSASRTGEAASFNEPIPFTSASDLTLQQGAPTSAFRAGIPATIPGLGLPNDLLNFDASNYRRVSANPTIGANELLTLVSSIGVSGQAGATTIGSRLGSLQMEANVLPLNATYPDIVWSASPSNVATISGTGLLQALGTNDGVVSVRATATDGSKVFGEALITISGQVLVSAITVSGTSGESLISVRGQNLQMLANVVPENASNKVVNWSVNNPAIATISGTGILTPIADGIVEVTASATDGSGISNMLVVTLTNQIWVNAINISAPGNNFNITVDKATLQLGATVLPANASNPAFAWSAIPADVGTISPTGLVSPIGNGSLTVTATALDAGGLVSTTVINITGQITLPQSISIAPAGNVTTYTVRGGNLQFIESVLPSTTTDKSVLWSVTPSERASINNTSGVLTAIADGVVTVTAVSNAVSSISGSYVLALSNQNAVTSVSVTGTSDNIFVGNSAILSASVLPANASNPAITWSSSDNSVATVSGIGQVRGVGSGVVTITATSVDVPSVQGTFIITVVQRVTAITVSGAGGINAISVLGGTLQMEANVAPASASNKVVTWTVSNTAIATINSVTGLLEAVANGTVLVTATATDGSGITGFRSVVLSNQTATPPPPSTTVTSFSLTGSASVNVGETIALTPVIEPSDVTVAGFTYASSDTDVATVSADGEVTGVSVGVVTITATFTLNSVDYTAEKEINVQSVTSANFNSFGALFNVYPIPALDGIISVSALQNANYTLINAMGVAVCSGAINAGVNTLPQVASGVYSLLIYNAASQAVVKIVVQ